MKINNIPLEQTSLSSNVYHLDLDNFIKEKLRSEKQLILESWLSGYDAQGIAGVFKIYVSCPDDSVRIDRLVNRDKMTIDQAKNHLKVREEEIIRKWELLYHTRDFWNSALYDLVIDTYTNGPNETLELTLKAIGFYS